MFVSASGASCIVWYMFWLCMVYEKPSHHPYISDKELDYIEDSHGSDCIEYEVSYVIIRQKHLPHLDTKRILKIIYIRNT